MPKSLILYAANRPIGNQHQLVQGPNGERVFIRVETKDGLDVSDALAEANPHEDEIVLNTIPCED
jgi:hypothetical protein